MEIDSAIFSGKDEETGVRVFSQIRMFIGIIENSLAQNVRAFSIFAAPIDDFRSLLALPHHIRAVTAFGEVF